VQAIVDPLSVMGQRLAPLLLSLRESANAIVEIVFSPKSDIKSMPLLSYYAFGTSPSVGACSKHGLDVGGMERPKEARAYFPQVPAERVLTMNVDVPEPWLVEVRRWFTIPVGLHILRSAQPHNAGNV
jgi:UDP-glucose:glycoprotein glucosyltransferase